MIKINLAERKRSSTSAEGGAGLSLDVNQLKEKFASLGELPLKKYALTLACGFLATYALDFYKSDQIKQLDDELSKLEAEKPKLLSEAGKIRSLEEVKKAMEADEFVIRTKLETIKRLVADRGSTGKILTELTKVMPADLWVTQFDLKGGNVNVKGFSLDFTRISDFMKLLSESSIFADPNLNDTQMARDDQNREVASFSIQARKR